MGNSSLPLTEAFYSFQGEGPFLGLPSLFLRMEGCSVGCHWCDTKYAWAESGNKISKKEVKKLIPKIGYTPSVTITGGEPFEAPDRLQEIFEFCQVNFPKSKIIVETSGTFPLVTPNKLKDDLHYVVSPKMQALRECYPEELKELRENFINIHIKVVLYSKMFEDIAQLRRVIHSFGAVGEVFTQPLYRGGEYNRFSSAYVQMVRELQGHLPGIPVRAGLQGHKHWGVQ